MLLLCERIKIAPLYVLKSCTSPDFKFTDTEFTPDSPAIVVAGELYNSNKKLLGAKDDLNNLSDGWYYYINANNPANTVSNADNSVLLQLSYKGDFRHAKFQLLFSENAKAIFFRLMENSKAWSRWVNLVRA